MKLEFFQKNGCRILLSIVLFFIVFCSFALMVKQSWFREDDLGTLINGRVTNLVSAVKVFFTDCRSFITPCNYQRTVPNFLSALWRPVQNYVFSIIFYVCGPDPMAFYFLQVFFHAANSVLLFILFSMFVPPCFAFGGGVLFAFYPSVSWMVWASTLQNSLSVFFIILMLICLVGFIKRFSSQTANFCLEDGSTISRGQRVGTSQLDWESRFLDPMLVLSGLCYFMSILSRESGIFLPMWLWFGVFISLMLAKFGFWSSMWNALKICWIFFAVNVIYFLLRIWAFGFGSLDRTFSNLFLRFQFLNKIFFVTQNAPAQLNDQSIQPASSALQTSCVAVSVSSTISSCATIKPTIISKIWQSWISWADAIFNLSLQSLFSQVMATILVLIFIVLVCFVFRRKKSLLLWLAFGLGCMLWPSVLTYPSPRYINAAYPFIIFIFIYSVYLFRQTHNILISKVIFACLVFTASGLLLHGIKVNITELQGFSLERVEYKKRFDQFFARYKFSPYVNFILVCSPYVSDIESIFQFYLKNYNVRLAFDPFSTIAERGTMGCGKDYKAVGVKSEIIKISGGFRLISHDPEHCGWWLRHSNFNVAWNSKDRAYRWTDKPYMTGIMYECSVGHFVINKMAYSDCVTDISFIYDPHWVNKNTVFVAWDTLKGEYYVIS